MRRNIKIRGRDGAIREVDDDYILADGETLMVPLNFMDARRSMIHDGHGNVAGQRPGFLFSDDEAVDQAVEAAYQQYRADIEGRWRHGPGQRTSPARSEPPQAFANPEAAVAASYETYRRDIEGRWRLWRR